MVRPLLVQCSVWGRLNRYPTQPNPKDMMTINACLTLRRSNSHTTRGERGIEIPIPKDHSKSTIHMRTLVQLPTQKPQLHNQQHLDMLGVILNRQQQHPSKPQLQCSMIQTQLHISRTCPEWCVCRTFSLGLNLRVKCSTRRSMMTLSRSWKSLDL